MHRKKLIKSLVDLEFYSKCFHLHLLILGRIKVLFNEPVINFIINLTLNFLEKEIARGRIGAPSKGS
jgi:hypothetical protein